MLLPTFSKGTPEIDESVYTRVKECWEKECQDKDNGYINEAFRQGSKK
jgi:hypothetical protein